MFNKIELVNEKTLIIGIDIAKTRDNDRQTF